MGNRLNSLARPVNTLGKPGEASRPVRECLDEITAALGSREGGGAPRRV